jgi:hypothetical protein
VLGRGKGRGYGFKCLDTDTAVIAELLAATGGAYVIELWDVAEVSW